MLYCAVQKNLNYLTNMYVHSPQKLLDNWKIAATIIVLFRLHQDVFYWLTCFNFLCYNEIEYLISKLVNTVVNIPIAILWHSVISNIQGVSWMYVIQFFSLFTIGSFLWWHYTLKHKSMWLCIYLSRWCFINVIAQINVMYIWHTHAHTPTHIHI